MGWLKDALGDVNIETLQELVQQLAEDERWQGPKGRSLLNYVSKLDKGDDKALAWWRRRGWALEALADVIAGGDLDQLEKMVAGTASPWIVALSPFPGVVVDLARDELFPGVPPVVLRPDRWQRHWWVAPSGSGRSLVGKWLEARLLSVHIEADTWADLDRHDMPATGAVLVELKSDDGTDYSQVELGGLRVCIAAPFSPPKPGVETGWRPRWAKKTRRMAVRPESPGDVGTPPKWHLVQTPPAKQWIGPLVTWLAERYSGLDAPAALSLLQSFAGWLETPGGALDLCGVAGQLKTKDPSFEALLGAYLANLLRRKPAISAGVGEWLVENGSQLLLSISHNVSAAGSALAAPLPAKEWMAHMPDGLVPGPDVEWAESVLADVNATDLTERDLEEIRTALRPTKRSLQRTLRMLGILRPHRDGLVIRPLWLIGIVEGQVVRAALDAGPKRYGQLLLAKPLTGKITQALARRLAEEPDPAREIDAAVSETDVTDPASVAALESMFRAAGLALLDGTVLPVDALERLWRAQWSLAVKPWTNGVHQQRLHHGDVRAMSAAEARDLFEVTCLLISEVLHKAGRGEHLELADAALDPWASTADPPEDLGTQIGKAGSLARHVHPSEVQRYFALHDLGARLYDRFGLLTAQIGPIPDVQGHAHLIARFMAGEEPQISTWMWNMPFVLDLIRNEATRKGADMEAVIEWLWGYWSTLDQQKLMSAPPIRWVGGESGRSRQLLGSADDTDGDAEWLWQRAPASVIRQSEALRFYIYTWKGFYKFISTDAQWEAVLDGAVAGSVRMEDDLWEYLPEHMIGHAIDAGLLTPAASYARATIWRRFPRRAHSLVRDESLEINHRARFAAAAPDSQIDAVLTLAESDTALCAHLMPWLYSLVEHRAKGWKRAYKLLA